MEVLTGLVVGGDGPPIADPIFEGIAVVITTVANVAVLSIPDLATPVLFVPTLIYLYLLTYLAALTTNPSHYNSLPSNSSNASNAFNAIA